MKRTSFLFLLLAVVAFAFTPPSAGGGIKFDHMRLADAIEKAKAGGKLIFIDVYTSWCGPCKQMAKTTFEAEEVGRLFNDKFINLKIDAEKDPDGAEVARKFGVNAYPTLLFINGSGKQVRKLIGFQSSEKLLSVASGL